MRALPIGSAIPPSNAAVPDYADMPAPKRLAMSYKKRKSTRGVVPLQNIHLPHLALSPRISLDASDRIAYPPALGAHLLVEGFESVAAVDPAVW
jgi:hypothetical protein